MDNLRDREREMEEVFEVSFADNNDDEENKEEYPNSGNRIVWHLKY